MLGKIICSSLPAGLIEEFSASKVHLHVLCNLTYWEVSQQTYVQKLRASLGLIIARINTTYQVLQTTNPLRHPALSLSQQHFPSKDISFFPNVPAIKTLIACRTDIMRSRSIGPSLQSYMTSPGSEHSSQFSTNQSIIAEFGRALLLQVTKRLICRKVCFRRIIKFQVKKQTNKQTKKV